MPNVQRQYADGMAKVLGKALLWLRFSPGSNYLPQALQYYHVQTACNNIDQLPAGENPVKKITLVISGNKG
jgi:hypothetical protein